MNDEAINRFRDSMIQIESFLSEIAARNSELRYIGVGSAKLWNSYKEASDSFGEFNRNYMSL